MRRIRVTTQHLVSELQSGKQISILAAEVGITRQAIWKRLKAAGIDISGRYWQRVDCGYCGTKLDRRKSYMTDKAKVFCNTECYYANRENPGYKPWRHGSRLARAIVAQRFALDSLHVVHHKDGDQRNNNLDNLVVYASQSDHIKAHHGKSKVTPVWDGAR